MKSQIGKWPQLESKVNPPGVGHQGRGSAGVRGRNKPCTGRHSIADDDAFLVHFGEDTGRTVIISQIQQISTSKTQQKTVLNSSFSKIVFFLIFFFFILESNQWTKVKNWHDRSMSPLTFFESVFHSDFIKQPIKDRMTTRSHGAAQIYNHCESELIVNLPQWCKTYQTC